MFENNSVLIIPNNIKNKVIKKINSDDRLHNIKYMSKEELYRSYYFSYDEKTIYYVMKKYNVEYDIAISYLDSIYYIEDKEYKNKKLDFLNMLKKELNNNGLLIYNKKFSKLIEEKKFLVYGYDYLKREDKKLLSNFSNVKYIKNDNIKYNNKYVYEAKDISDECNFVANKIVELIKNGISVDKIKIMGISEEYYNIISRIFKFYNLKIDLNDRVSLYDTKSGKIFLDTLSLENIKDKNIYNKLVKILNKYTWISYNEAKDLICHDLKNTYLDQDKYTNTIEVITANNYLEEEDEFVFLMNFNQGFIPKVYKDEYYLTDKDKKILDMSTSYELNKLEKNHIINLIKETKNLIITCKLSSINGECYVSSIKDELNLETINIESKYKYSNMYNKIKLASYLDDLIKYGNKNKDIDTLFNTYSDINYMSYNNSYTKIAKEKVNDYLDNSLKLSYSSMNNYYKCSFRYYIANILKLNIYEETFMTYIGSLFHYILSISFDDNFDLDKEYDKYLNQHKREFNLKEKHFVMKLKKELEFIINTIKYQYNYTNFDKFIYEKQVDVKIDDRTTFTGIIDKTMYKEDVNTLVAIIDYKTGNTNINLNNIIYGLDMQLPIYLYLTYHNEKFTNPQIVGFYLQKIINNIPLKDCKYSLSEIKKNNLKLEGYSINDEILLSSFDQSYEDSKVIASLKKSSKGFYSYSKVLTPEKISKIVNITEEKIKEASHNILEAKFDINPKEIGNRLKGCEFCEYRELCFRRNEDIVKYKEYKNLEFLN